VSESDVKLDSFALVIPESLENDVLQEDLRGLSSALGDPKTQLCATLANRLGELEDVRTTQDGTIPRGGPEFVQAVRELFFEPSKDFLERLECLHELNPRADRHIAAVSAA
jgi:hypothetical protein